MRRTFGFIIGAIVGGMIGATAAMLFAPSSGEELRALIDQRTRGFTADIRQAASSKRIELQDRLDDLRAPRSQ